MRPCPVSPRASEPRCRDRDDRSSNDDVRTAHRRTAVPPEKPRCNHKPASPDGLAPCLPAAEGQRGRETEPHHQGAPEHRALDRQRVDGLIQQPRCRGEDKSQKPAQKVECGALLLPIPFHL